MNKIIKILPIVVILAGCAHPGSNMSERSVGNQRVKTVDITPAVLRDQRLSDRTETAEKRVRDLFAAEQPYVYRVGPQDVLSITVWDHPELTIPAGEFRTAEAAGHLVAEDGTIFYPFIGQVKVAGMTVAEIRRMLTSRLAVQIRNPQLDVRVAAFRSQRAYVVGAVAAPGVQPITDVALTTVEAISRAGDVTPDSDMTNVTLTRNGVTYDLNLLSVYEYGDVSQNVVLGHGDILSIPDRNLQKVFVLGSVAAPATQIMHKGRLSLAEALSDAGGLNEKEANASAVYVIRGTSDDPEIFRLNAKSPGALILADQFRLAPRDIVYVETSAEIRASDRLDRLLSLTRMLNDLSDINFPLGAGGADD